jgi:hypothetical protein
LSRRGRMVVEFTTACAMKGNWFIDIDGIYDYHYL